MSLLYNQLSEEDCFEVIETSLDHPNLEILQIADKIKDAESEDEEEEEQPKSKKKKQQARNEKPISQAKVSLCRGIQIRLQ
jgi:hypothetical protein